MATSFIDESEMVVHAGAGGDGCIAFRRAKYVPFGGPAGGDGGNGGSVVLVGDEGLGTLQDVHHKRVVKAEPGKPGEGRDMFGRGGKDAEIRVPLGTIVRDGEVGAVLGEVTEDGQRLVVAKGGIGGRGNKRFATPVDKAPRRAEPGTPGESRTLRLELKVMADVGLLGFPNVGKSTFIRAVSRARPRVADYPFTTLEPHLGVATIGDPGRGLGRSFVVADIPGLIPGASDGAGLGYRFLRHVERTRVLLHLVTLSDEPERTPLGDYLQLRKELEHFDPDLSRRPEVVAMSKADLPDVQEAFEELKAEFAKRGIELHLVSAATRTGIDGMLEQLAKRLFSAPDDPL